MITSDQVKAGVMLAAVGVVGLIAWQVYKKAGAAGDYIGSLPGRIGDTVADAYQSVSEAGSAAIPYVNPASDQNLIYSGISAVGSAATGTKDWSLGTAIYDWTHPDEYASTTINTAAQNDAKRISTGGASGSW